MDALDELNQLLRNPQRKLVVSADVINLNVPSGTNSIYVFMVPLTEGAAGGRAGGLGQRSIEKVYRFSYSNGQCLKDFEASDEDIISSIEFPVGIARIPAVLKGGVEEMLYGVVDSESVKSYDSQLKI